MKLATEPRGWERLFWPVLTATVLLSLWQFSVLWSGTKVFPSPLEVERGLAQLARKHLLWGAIGDSLRRVALGYGLAALVGIPLGLALGLYPAAYRLFRPVLEILRPISPIAWIPVAILLFGVGEPPAVFLIFLATFFPVLAACVNSVDTVPAVYRRAGSNFGLTGPQVLWRVIFPATLPQILIGLRIALGVAWLVVVAAEMIAVDSGLGYLVIDSRNSGKHYDLVVAAMLVIGAMGLVLDLCFRRLQRLRPVRWGFRGVS